MSEFKQVIELFSDIVFASIAVKITENVTWQYYTGETTSCGLCQIPIINRDKIHIKDCDCLFHNNCIVSYYNRIDKNCPKCGVLIPSKDKEIREKGNLMLKDMVNKFSCEPKGVYD